MTQDISSSADMIDVRDIIARVEELESDMPDADDTDAREAWAESDEGIECTILQSLLSNLAGYGGDEQWRGVWYPITLIRDSYFVDAMKELCEDIGDFPNGVPSYYVIDWQATADNLRADYSSVEYDDVTYWYR